MTGQISIETAKLAKEKGYEYLNEQPTYSYYEDGGAIDLKLTQHDCYVDENFIAHAPTSSELRLWIWDNHQIWADCKPLFSANEFIGVHLSITSWKFPVIVIEEADQFDVRKGLEQVIFEALKLIDNESSS